MIVTVEQSSVVVPVGHVMAVGQSGASGDNRDARAFVCQGQVGNGS
jgi:hypothetical protein